jgi:hypothetical protein
MTYNTILGLEGEVPPQLQLQAMISGKWVSQAIFAAAELGIADQINNEPRSAQEVADAVGAKTETTYRLMRALGSLGILEELENKCFTLTDIGKFLRSDHNESMRAFSRFIGYESNWRAWESLDESVRTGKTGYAIAYGMEIFDYLGKHPQAANVFNDALVVTNHVALCVNLIPYTSFLG